MWTWLAIAFGAPTITVGEAIEGPVHQRLSADPADLVILYAGEQEGSQDPCGCPGRPRGSLGRVEAYAQAVRGQDAPVLLVNAGHWLKDTTDVHDQLSPVARLTNAHMLDAVQAGSWTALNVGFRDLPYLAQVGQHPPGAVLANGSGPGAPPPYVLATAGSRTVAITGVTTWARAYLQPDTVQRTGPVEALAALLPELRERADVVVVLGFGLGRRASEVADLDIDVLIEADQHQGRYEPVVRDHTVWVRSNPGTQRLGELRLSFDAQGRIAAAHDRAIDLDDGVAMDRAWKKRSRAAARALKALGPGTL